MIAIIPRSALVWACWLGAMLLSAPAHEPPTPCIVVVRNGQVYVVSVEPSKRPAVASDRLAITRVDLLPNGALKSFTYELTRLDPCVPCRWRIANGCFWGVAAGVEPTGGDAHGLRIPLDELRFADPHNPRGYAEALKRYPRSRAFNPGMKYGWRPDPVGDYMTQIQRRQYTIPGKPDELGPVTDYFYDILPIAADDSWLLMIHKGGCDVWRGKGTWSTDREVWDMTWSDKPVETFPVGFLEPFWVTGSEQQFRFVTQSGKLIFATKQPDGSRKVTREWTRGSQPIAAVVTDADAGRSFAFTRPARNVQLDGPPQYFMLSPDPVAAPYDRDALLKDAKDEPARLTALARFLVEQKKVVLPR